MFPMPSFLVGANQGSPTSFDPANKASNVTLSNSNRTVSGTNASFGTVKSLQSKSAGKYYLEVVFGSTDTSGQFGIAKSTMSNTSSGVASADAVVAEDASGGSVWVGTNAQTSSNISGGNNPAVNDRWDMAVDLDNNRIWYRRNGGSWNVNGSANPATNVGGYDISTWRASAAVYLICVVASASAAYTWNFGTTQYLGTPPFGFSTFGTP